MLRLAIVLLLLATPAQAVTITWLDARGEASIYCNVANTSCEDDQGVPFYDLQHVPHLIVPGKLRFAAGISTEYATFDLFSVALKSTPTPIGTKLTYSIAYIMLEFTVDTPAAVRLRGTLGGQEDARFLYDVGASAYVGMAWSPGPIDLYEPVDPGKVYRLLIAPNQLPVFNGPWSVNARFDVEPRAVPEPGTAALVGLGLALLAREVRRERR